VPFGGLLLHVHATSKTVETKLTMNKVLASIVEDDIERWNDCSDEIKTGVAASTEK